MTTDFLVLYDVKRGWQPINEQLVSNIVRIYQDEARIHVYGLKTWSPELKLALVREFTARTQFEQAVFMDSDTALMRRLDVFDDPNFDLAVPLRRNKGFLFVNPKIPVHQFFNTGVLFFRPSARGFIQAWQDLVQQAVARVGSFHTIEQAVITQMLLQGRYDLTRLTAYEEGLAPGELIELAGCGVKLVDEGHYNKGVLPLPPQASILHFTADTPLEIPLQQLRAFEQSVEQSAENLAGLAG